MKDWLLEHPKVLVGIFVLIIVLPFVVPRGGGNPPEDWEEALRRAEGRPMPPPPDSERVQAARKLSREDPAAGLAATESIVAEPQDGAEQTAARELLAEVLQTNYNHHARADAYDAARPFWARLRSDFPDHHRTRSVHTNWGQLLTRQIEAAVAIDDSAAVQSLFLEYTAGAFYQPRRDLARPSDGNDGTLRTYAEFQLKRWVALPAESRLRREGLVLAADGFGMLLDHNDTARLGRVLREDATVFGAELIALYRVFDRQELPVHALNALSWANQMLTRDGAWRSGAGAELEHADRVSMRGRHEARMSTLVSALARTVHDSPDTLLTALRADSFLEAALRRIDSAEHRSPVLRTRWELAIENFMEATESLATQDLMPLVTGTAAADVRSQLGRRLHDARGKGHTIEGRLRDDLFQNMVRDHTAEIWVNVPAEIVSRIDADLRANLPADRREQERREALRRLVRAGDAPMPVGLPATFQERQMQVAALNGVHRLDARPGDALSELRRVLRESGNAILNERVRRAIQAAFRRSQQAEKFDLLIELAGFYAAEFSEDLATSEFGAEFREAMVASAAAFKSREPMKHVFVQALMADAFPDEEVGRLARSEVISGAFALVSHQTTQTEFGDVRLPSALAGASSVAVDNSTDYHILLVYDGPESFAVLCDPRRKGSFALQNGTYRIAVMTPLGDIQPYRAERTLANEHAPANYRIERSDTSPRESQFRGYSNAQGEYTLLRTGDFDGTVVVDAETGLVFPERGPVAP